MIFRGKITIHGKGSRHIFIVMYMCQSRICVYNKPGHPEMAFRIKGNFNIYPKPYWERTMSHLLYMTQKLIRECLPYLHSFKLLAAVSSKSLYSKPTQPQPWNYAHFFLWTFIFKLAFLNGPVHMVICPIFLSFIIKNSKRL